MNTNEVVCPGDGRKETGRMQSDISGEHGEAFYSSHK